jgi:ABC-type transport system involved in multi-copper enzyme maturation permease subunit
MGLNPIGYKPWTGKRTEQVRRFQVIADFIFRRNLSSKWFLGVLIIGTFLTFALPIIMLSISPHEALTGDTMASQMGNGLFYLFIVILASMICSDLLAEDLRSNSFVLYFSRAIRPERYLLGKVMGAVATLAVFAFLPPLIMAVAITATQTGLDYLSSVKVIGETVLAGLWGTIFLIPIGLMLSCFTKRRTYAAAGTFMVVFVLGIISGIFAGFDPNWRLLDPGSVLSLSFDAIYGQGLPADIDPLLLAVVALAFTVLPLAFAYFQVLRKGVGK